MWFKNLRIYRFRDIGAVATDALEQQLQGQAFTPCHKTQAASIGWVPPVKDGDVLTHKVGQYIMLCAHKEEKLLPAAVLNQHLQQRIADIEAEQSRKVGAREKAQLKEEIHIDLLPRAFSRHRQLHAFMALEQQLLVVNSTSASQAETLITLLRDSVGALGLLPVRCQLAPSVVMTQWLQSQQADGGFELADECELVNPREDGNVVRCRGQDLAAEEIGTHLQSGKQVRQLALNWQQQLSCIITDDLAIKRLRFDELVTDQATADDADSVAEQFDQDFAVMTLTLAPFFDAMFAAFGGLHEED